MKDAQTCSRGYETCPEPAAAGRRGREHHKVSASAEETHEYVLGLQGQDDRGSGWIAEVHTSDRSSHCTDPVLVAAYHTCPAVVES
jgi:hypothetical protein